MKRQFLHESHNLQDKAKKPDYQGRFQDERDNFDRGGTSQGSALGDFKIRGSHVVIDLRPTLNAEKQELLQILDCRFRFRVDGNVGTIPRLMKNYQLALNVRERYRMTRQSIVLANTFHWAQHPKKNRQIRVLEFRCFLEPVEPFQTPIIIDVFAFLPKVVRP